MPNVGSIVAMPVSALLHVPLPGVADNDEVVLPAHTVADPEITGTALTVTIELAAVPQPFEYDIVDVPAESALTTPVVPTVATRVLELVHTPPAVASVKFVVDPAQTISVPVIVTGAALTVTVLAVEQPPAVT